MLSCRSCAAAHDATSDIIAAHLYRFLFVRPLVRRYFMTDLSITFVIWDVLQLTETAGVDVSDASQPRLPCVHLHAPANHLRPLWVVNRSAWWVFLFFPCQPSPFISQPQTLPLPSVFHSSLLCPPVCHSSFSLPRRTQSGLCAGDSLKYKTHVCVCYRAVFGDQISNTWGVAQSERMHSSGFWKSAFVVGKM